MEFVSKLLNSNYVPKKLCNLMVKKRKFRPGVDWVWYAPNTFDAYGATEIRAVKRSLEKGWLAPGPLTKEFEKKIAALYGKKHGLFVNSGSSANLLALSLLGLPPGSEVITPACTFSTTLNPILQLGLMPVFVDVDLGTYVTSPRHVLQALSKKTRALLLPHLLGNLLDMPRLGALCRKHKIFLIEDSCDTIGSRIDGRKSGFWSDLVTTSFYASHVITAAGAGGMIMANKASWMKRARVLRDWGRGISRYDEDIRSRLAKWKIEGKPYDSAFVFVERGYNLKATEPQAAFALSQLRNLSRFIAARKWVFQKIHRFLKRYERYLILPTSLPGFQPVWLAFPITLREGAPFSREEIVKHLEDHKIQTRPLFSGNIIKHPAYRGMRYRRGSPLENSDYILGHSFLIGAHHGLGDAMLDYLFSVFEGFFKKQS